MTALWAVGARRPIAMSEEQARSTVEPIRTDGPPELHEEPEFNQLNTDDSGELVGLAPRAVVGDTHESVQYVPQWAAVADMQTEAAQDVNVRQARVGTAAAREAAGIQGHGTMQYQVDIEPVIRDGAVLGNQAFVFDQRDVQEGSGVYMNANVGDDALNGNNQYNALAAAFAARNAREATNATLFANWGASSE